MNNQPIEKPFVNSTGRELDVADMFLTLQGEGPFSGKRAVFIRLAGCNLRCPACDTDYTSQRASYTTRQIVKQVEALTARFDNKGETIVVITGGEPFRQNITPLCNQLIHKYTVQIETNGTLPPSRFLSEFVYIVCSPKTTKINKELFLRANAFKYVIDHSSINEIDGLPISALQHPVVNRVARPRTGVPVYVTPMDTEDYADFKRNREAVSYSALYHGYIAQLQIHKILGLS